MDREMHDLAECVKRIERQVTRVEQATVSSSWRKIGYRLTIAFLCASAVRYWIGKADKPVYVPLPCVERPLEAYHGR